MPSWVRPVEPRTGRCAGCGFLVLRDVETGELVGADSDFRTTGEPGVGGNFYEAFGDIPLPHCLEREIPLAELIESNPKWQGDGTSKVSDARRRFINETIIEERECPSYFRWRQGATPREHREMAHRESMLTREDRIRAELHDREDRRDREMRQREDERDSRLENLQREFHRRELLILGGVVTFALGVSSVVAAILEGAVSQGWEPSWWPF